ncbi:MAG TPA: potassium-transporting ATPase subunit KdpC [Leptospiraceae bacterium]|jgi:K+-transporting ATPase ATPase C chain|nr:potassium-transporting ATPase subunit KdpC [Leptospirales bacterium]HMX57256.1 potassium-transporting ATPase subunit KdpC [Leptospiraceae bacterium]HMZ36578.1 potassium-transporting ATPase subunit KdpC [Leptospiraceae bacterium]HNE25265.1 potassium-transporting ATPase subunit KdpC [Leptospiraceae bacterium]HNJ35505.1 potassium-transporting ATPase subunit KdpC [Leptospiraceae bacterium]
MRIIKHAFLSLASLIVLTVFTGWFYPWLVTTIARSAFPDRAEGSLVRIGGEIRGSELIAQKFSGDRYFWPRPSAGDYATVPSSASNLGPSSAALAKAIQGRKDSLAKAHNGIPPADMVTTSASGLDPEISPEAARYQLDRVARARRLNESQKEELRTLVEQSVLEPTFGFLGESRVNVLRLNLALDERYPIQQ